MTSQCAWCDCYLTAVFESGSVVTHGICEACAERVLRSMDDVRPILKEVLRSTQGQVSELKHVA